MVNIERIVIYVVVIVVGLVLAAAYFLPGGSFEKVKGAFDKTKSYLPDIGIGAEQVHAENPAIPPEHYRELASLKDAIQRMLYSEKDNCFTSYISFSELGEQGTTIDFKYDAANQATHVVVSGGAGGKQVVAEESFNFIGMKPCVIAGATSVVDNFDHAFLNRKEGVPSSYFTDVNFIRIAYDTSGFNENRISYGNSVDQLTEYHDFEGDGWLFTPDNTVGNKQICFFPTSNSLGGCAARSGLLDDDCFIGGEFSNIGGQAITDEQIAARAEARQPTEEISIPNLVAGGSLEQC